jgi:hypothetical protein
MAVETFTSSTTWTCPAGVTEVLAECWGGGGGGGGSGTTNGRGGNGGAGGAYARKTIAVTAGNGYTVTVGTGGNGGAAGNNPGVAGNPSWFSTAATVFAQGGAGGGQPDQHHQPLHSVHLHLLSGISLSWR